jgi:hypothetical protein
MNPASLNTSSLPFADLEDHYFMVDPQRRALKIQVISFSLFMCEANNNSYFYLESVLIVLSFAGNQEKLNPSTSL